MDFDFASLAAAAGVFLAGVLAGLYVNFRKSAAEDGVDNWKDDVVEAVEEFDNKVDGK